MCAGAPGCPWLPVALSLPYSGPPGDWTHSGDSAKTYCAERGLQQWGAAGGAAVAPEQQRHISDRVRVT